MSYLLSPDENDCGSMTKQLETVDGDAHLPEYFYTNDRETFRLRACIIACVQVMGENVTIVPSEQGLAPFTVPAKWWLDNHTEVRNCDEHVGKTNVGVYINSPNDEFTWMTTDAFLEMCKPVEEETATEVAEQSIRYDHGELNPRLMPREDVNLNDPMQVREYIYRLIVERNEARMERDEALAKLSEADTVTNDVSLDLDNADEALNGYDEELKKVKVDLAIAQETLNNYDTVVKDRERQRDEALAKLNNANQLITLYTKAMRGLAELNPGDMLLQITADDRNALQAAVANLKLCLDRLHVAEAKVEMVHLIAGIAGGRTTHDYVSMPSSEFFNPLHVLEKLTSLLEQANNAYNPQPCEGCPES